MSKTNDSNKLAIQMLIAMISGILVGLLFMAAREFFGHDSLTWNTINNLLFQDITATGAERAIGLFYIVGQLFIRALQLVAPSTNQSPPLISSTRPTAKSRTDVIILAYFSFCG